MSSTSRLHEPIALHKNGEIDVLTLTKRAVPSLYSHILYIVHPTIVDGDRSHVAQQTIQDRVDTEPQANRVVLIAPPQGCTYLNSKTKVTDIRTSEQDANWAESEDFQQGLNGITLVGGNLERCIGATFDSIIWKLGMTMKQKGQMSGVITVNLPLDAIYTMGERTAADNLFGFMNLTGNQLEAALAILTAYDSYNRTYVAGINRNTEIVSSYGAGTYTIAMNGKTIANLAHESKKIDMITVPDGFIRVGIPKVPNIHVNLNLSYKDRDRSRRDESNFSSIPLAHVRENVLPKYEVTSP